MTKKNSLLALLKIFEDNTDDDNKLSKKKILGILAAKYGIDMEEKQFYRKIQELKDNGYAIEMQRIGKSTYYFMRKSRLTKEEWIYLICLLMGNRDLSVAETRKIVQSLEGMSVCLKSRAYYQKYRGQMTRYKTPVNTLNNFSVVLDAIDNGLPFSCKLKEEAEGEICFSERKTLLPTGFFFRNNRVYLRIREGEGEAEIPLHQIIDAEIE